MIKLDRNKKIGLALGGGAVLGAAHIGIFKALDELDIPISCVAGTSIGAFVASLFAFGKNWQEMKEISGDINWLDVSSLTLSQYALLSNKKIGELIKGTIGDVEFNQADIPLAVITTDISTGQKVILKEGNVAQSVMASTCIPGVFKPVNIDNRQLVDGGIVENVPISPLLEMGADIILAVDLLGKPLYKKPEHIIGVLINSFYIFMMNITKMQTEKADVILAPDLSKYNLIDTHQVPELIQIGYLEAKKVLQEFF